MLDSLIWLAFFLPPAASATTSVVRAARGSLDPGVAGELRARSDPRLALRAERRDVAGANAPERDALRAAERAGPGLPELRAGIGVETVLVAALVVLLVVLIV